MSNKLHVKKDDNVVVIAGKDKGKKGKILVCIPKDERVIVENVNIITRHTKPRKQGEQGGRIKREGTIHASNVMLLCKHCNSATRVAIKMDGDKRVRTCKKCGRNID